ncbi:MAG: class I SAM-dependent methyltransferase [Limnochordia bacterium]|jgi:16S rRNA (guanine1207-N2)-methyltransferase
MSPDHYFSVEPQTDHKTQLFTAQVRGVEMEFFTDRGVFSKNKLDRGTRLLLDTIQVPPEGSCLDLGCGYGPIGLFMAKKAPQATVYMVDINQRAVDLARANLARNGVRAHVYQGNGLEPLAGIRFDCIACNPPYRAGRATVMALLTSAYAALKPGGILYIVGRTAQGIKTLARLLEEELGSCREAAKGGGFRVFTVEKPPV